MCDISVVVPLYKGKKFIKRIMEMISSNASQLCYRLNVELILINDYPQEKISCDFINSSPNFKLVICENKRNMGIHASRIAGFHNSKGKYILFLDQDDLIADDYLLSQWQLISDADVVVCNGIQKNKLIYLNRKTQENILYIDEWIKGVNLIISPGQALIRKEAIPQIWLDNIMVINGVDDFFLWLSLHNTNARFKINEEELFNSIRHGDNTSANLTQMKYSLMELNDIVEKLEVKLQVRLAVTCLLNKLIEAEKNRSTSIISILSRLLYSYQNNISIEQLLLNKNYKKIAIYGMGILGQGLYSALRNSTCIEIVCGIDKNAEIYRYEFPIYKPDDNIPIVDVVIVTTPYYYDEIEQDLITRMSYEIISIEDIF